MQALLQRLAACCLTLEAYEDNWSNKVVTYMRSATYWYSVKTNYCTNFCEARRTDGTSILATFTLLDSKLKQLESMARMDWLPTKEVVQDAVTSFSNTCWKNCLSELVSQKINWSLSKTCIKLWCTSGDDPQPEFAFSGKHSESSTEGTHYRALALKQLLELVSTKVILIRLSDNFWLYPTRLKLDHFRGNQKCRRWNSTFESKRLTWWPNCT